MVRERDIAVNRGAFIPPSDGDLPLLRTLHATIVRTLIALLIIVALASGVITCGTTENAVARSGDADGASVSTVDEEKALRLAFLRARRAEAASDPRYQAVEIAAGARMVNVRHQLALECRGKELR